MSGKSPRQKSRKRLPSSGDGDSSDFDYELARPQKVPLLSTQEEVQRNLRLLADLRLTAAAAGAAEEADDGVVDFDDGVQASVDGSPSRKKAKKKKKEARGDGCHDDQAVELDSSCGELKTKRHSLKSDGVPGDNSEVSRHGKVKQRNRESISDSVHDDDLGNGDGRRKKKKKVEKSDGNPENHRDDDAKGLEGSHCEVKAAGEISISVIDDGHSNATDATRSRRKKKTSLDTATDTCKTSDSVHSNGHSNTTKDQNKQKAKRDRKKSDSVSSEAPSNAIDTTSAAGQKVKDDPSNSVSNGVSMDINRGNQAGGAQFAFAFDFGEGGELDLDAEIVESADVDFAAPADEFADEAAPAFDDPDVPSSKAKRRQPAAAAAAGFHPFCASTRPGVDFFARRPDPESAEFLDDWRSQRDFIKADVVRTSKRAAAAKAHSSATGKAKSAAT